MDLQVDDKILVRDYDSDSWTPRYFYKQQDNVVYVFADGATSWSENGTELWYQWKVPDPDVPWEVEE